MDYVGVPEVGDPAEEKFRNVEDLLHEIKAAEKQMREAAKALEFEKAAELRDRLKMLRARELKLK